MKRQCILQANAVVCVANIIKKYQLVNYFISRMISRIALDRWKYSSIKVLRNRRVQEGKSENNSTGE